MRRSSSGKNLHEFREITPFYMQHSYSHFRFDPSYYSQPPKTPSKTEHSMHERTHPCQERRMSNFQRKPDQGKRLPKEGLNTSTNERKSSNPEDCDSRTIDYPPSKLNSYRRKSCADVPSTFRRFSSNLLSEKHSSSLDENIQRWNLKGAALLEQTVATNNDGTEPSDQIDNQSLTRKTFSLDGGMEEMYGPQNTIITRTLQTHSYQDPAKVKRLKELLQDRVGKGHAVADLANEPAFEDVLDICDQYEFSPAYGHGEELTFDNYQALRKCKYLRVSEKNIASLKEAALQFLNEKED